MDSRIKTSRWAVGSGIGYSDNLTEVLYHGSSQKELRENVKGAWINGASVSEIQWVYDKNLLRLKSSSKEIKNPKDLLILNLLLW